MGRYLFIGVLMVAGIILVCSEAASGGMLATMGVKLAGILCLGAVAYKTKGEEA